MASITARINASTGSGPKKVSVTLPSGTSLQINPGAGSSTEGVVIAMEIAG